MKSQLLSQKARNSYDLAHIFRLVLKTGPWCLFLRYIMYGGFQMNETRLIQNQLLNVLKSFVLISLMAALLGLIAYILAGTGLAVFVFFMIGIIYLFSPTMAPKLVMRFYRTRPLSSFDAPHIHRVLRALSSRAGLERLPDLFLIPNRTMAAFTAGDKEKSAVALSAGLINRLDPDEIAGVMAHEISHIRNNDMQGMWFALLVSRVTDFLSMAGQVLLFINLPLILFNQVTISWVAIAILILAPSLSYLIQLSLSRVNEFNADLGSAELLGTPEPLISALAKIETSHNGILDRFFLRKQSDDASALFRTHPPTGERIRRLKDMRVTSVHSPFTYDHRDDDLHRRRPNPPRQFIVPPM